MADPTGKFGTWLGRLAELGYDRVEFTCWPKMHHWEARAGELKAQSSVGEEALQRLVEKANSAEARHGAR